MTIEIKVPTLPESVTDAVIAKWYKKVGDSITRDENLVDLETDKVMLEVPAPRSGVIEKIIEQEGAVVKGSQLLAIIREGDVAPVTTDATESSATPDATESRVAPDSTESRAREQAKLDAAALTTAQTASTLDLSPSERRAVHEGKNISSTNATQTLQRAASATSINPAQTLQGAASVNERSSRTEQRVPMSRLRQKVAQRLKEVQNTAAILTTFNEINMKPVMDLRNRYKDEFEKTTGSRLGFMSFFTKAAIEALKQFPAVNASIDGADILYHHYFDIGIAIGSERGLVVPVLRNADQLSMANIEKQIRDYAKKASDGKIAMEDLMGGTFTITNAGTYGSMMSTPIINPPQSAILGMHNIVERAVVDNNQIVIRPMMYVALSYDHRIIDGREAVLFLMAIKKLIEDPARFLLQI